MSQLHFYGRHQESSKNIEVLQEISCFPLQVQTIGNLHNQAHHQMFDILHISYQSQ